MALRGVVQHTQESVVELKNVSFSLDNEPVLENISMSFPRGKLAAITGPAGCGKSTLLKLAAGLLCPDSGSVYIEGKQPSTLPTKELFQMRKNSAFVFQDAALISNLSVFDNIALPLRYHHRFKEAEIVQKVEQMLNSFNLDNERDLLPAHLSTGQRKLASFARALIIEPSLIFFDEPIAGIDAVACTRIIDRILPLRDDPGITIIMASHNLDFIKSSADYIALLYRHRLFAYSQRDHILKSTDPVLQQILSIIVDEEEAVANEILKILTWRKEG